MELFGRIHVFFRMDIPAKIGTPTFTARIPNPQPTLDCSDGDQEQQDALLDARINWLV